MSQPTPKVIYLIISGAVSTNSTPDLIRELTQFDLPIYTFMTDNAFRLISPWQLAGLPGHQLVEGYFDPVLAGERKPGLTLIAPATFNTVNKLSQGIADTLAHSLAAEAIGAGWPVIVAPSVNAHLARHPRFSQSLNTLRSWGVTICGPHQTGDMMQMASIETLIAAVSTILEGKRNE
ncbi:MAG: hypothetical protein H6631_11065 [Anaerolineaceae bacterium]|nr:hypothetical protein [Anaerolineaceae bacterium]MCB9098686.1 hypothetical protein [Anaerolineales bacterium]